MKRNLFFNAFFALAVAAGMASCNRSDESDFNGGDNYIINFGLTISGVTYQAAITGDQIIMSVPEGISLNGAAVEVTLSENALISPNPSEITNWNQEEQFVVTSYGRERKSYLYRLSRTAVSTSGNVVLTTQDEVDAFAATGVSVIDGNLTIGKISGSAAADTIRNLSGLSALRQVVYNITVNNTYAGEDLSGLSNLEKTGGLTVGTIASLTDIYFPKLKTVGTNLSIGSTTAKEVKMPELTFVGESFTVKSDALTVADFGKLAEVTGNMIYNGTNASAQNNKMETVTLPKLETVGGTLTMTHWVAATKLEMPVLKSIGGLATLTYWNKIDAMNFPLLESAGGLTMNNANALVDLSLPALKTLNGAMTLTLSGIRSLFVTSLTKITSASASTGLTLTLSGATDVSFPELESVIGTLQIPATAANLVMPYFPKLKYVGILDLRSPVMTDLAGFEALEEVGTSLDLYGTTALNVADVRGIKIPRLNVYTSTYTNGFTIIGDEVFSGILNLGSPSGSNLKLPELVGIKKLGGFIAGLSSYAQPMEYAGLEEITGAFDVNGNNLPIIKMPNLKKMGSMSFSYCYGMTELHMPELVEITGTFNYPVVYSASYGPGLKVINFDKLKRVGGNFTLSGIVNNHAITGINMPLIESVGGTITITGTSNTIFKDVSNFSNLTSAGGVITISGFTNLIAFAGFKNVVPVLDANTWKISGCGYNPTYQNMVDGVYNKP